MNVRFIFAVVLGAGILFGWGFVFHELLPWGMAGFKELPQDREEEIIGAINTHIEEMPAMYFFPGPLPKPEMTQEEIAAAMHQRTDKLAANPHGILIVSGPVENYSMTPQLLVQGAICLAGALLASLLMLHAAPATGFFGRVVFVTLLGLFAGVVVVLPYWNWYEFPLEFTQAAVLEHVAGFFLAGIVLAALIKPTVKPIQTSGTAVPPPKPM